MLATEEVRESLCGIEADMGISVVEGTTKVCLAVFIKNALIIQHAVTPCPRLMPVVGRDAFRPRIKAETRRHTTSPWVVGTELPCSTRSSRRHLGRTLALYTERASTYLAWSTFQLDVFTLRSDRWPDTASPAG